MKKILISLVAWFAIQMIGKEGLAQFGGEIVWDTDTLRVHDEFNSEWCTSPVISPTFSFNIRLENDALGLGWITFSIDSIDQEQSMLVELVFDSDGICDWAMVPMTSERASAWEHANGFASFQRYNHYFCSTVARSRWGEFWEGYWHYLTNPWEMDGDLQTGFYVSGGIGIGAGVLAGGIVVAPVVASTTFTIPTVTITTTTTGGISGGGMVLGGTATTVSYGTVTVSGTTVVQAGAVGTAVYMSTGGGLGGSGGSSAGGGSGSRIPDRTELLRKFFRGETIENTPQNVEWLYWYRQKALDVLERYKRNRYAGPGIATQTERLRQIAQQLAQWGL